MIRMRVAGAVAAVAGAALIGGGIAVWTAGGGTPRFSRPVPTVHSVPVAGESRVRTRTILQAATGPASLAAGATLRLVRFGTTAPIVAVGAEHGVLQVPRDPRTLGWWRGGRAPGDDSGTTVLVGHVNYAGVSGILSALPRLRPGDELTLTEPGQVLRYRIVALRTFAKSRGLPASVFRRQGEPQLVLITCGGPFDAATGNYVDNLVAYAQRD